MDRALMKMDRPVEACVQHAEREEGLHVPTSTRPLSLQLMASFFTGEPKTAQLRPFITVTHRGTETGWHRQTSLRNYSRILSRFILSN